MGEADVGGFLQYERDAAAPCFDVLDAAQEIGDERIAATGYLRGFESPQGDAFHECSRIADFDTIREDGDADFVGVAVIAVAEGVDDCFAECLAVDFRHVHTDKSFEPHAYTDVLQDIFFGFFDEREDVALEIVLVDDRSGRRGGEDGATELEKWWFGKEHAGGVEIMPCRMKA